VRRPCPNVSGTVEDDVTPADVIGPNGQGIEPGSFAEIVRAMRSGTSYVNIHTTRWPAGEIRGQINDRDQRQFEG
jgi:CHRD domain